MGVVAGYFGRAVDAVLSRSVDVLLAFPGIVLAIVVAGLFTRSITVGRGRARPDRLDTVRAAVPGLGDGGAGPRMGGRRQGDGRGPTHHSSPGTCCRSFWDP